MGTGPELICVCGHAKKYHTSTHGGFCTYEFYNSPQRDNNDHDYCGCLIFLNKNAPLVPVKKKKPKNAYRSLDMSPNAIRDRKIAKLEKRIKALEGTVFGGLDKS